MPIKKNSKKVSKSTSNYPIKVNIRKNVKFMSLLEEKFIEKDCPFGKHNRVSVLIDNSIILKSEDHRYYLFPTHALSGLVNNLLVVSDKLESVMEEAYGEILSIKIIDYNSLNFINSISPLTIIRM